jgi:aspartyl-tRNA(Asn)/glutamyl-tRNA(Gln) amidotransferase subunit A
MNILAFATIKTLQDMLARKEISPGELLDFFLKRFESFDHTLDTALEVFTKDSLSISHTATGSLYAIPGILKDNICQQGRTVSCASKMLEHFVSPYNATVVDRLINAGGLCIGRANMDEFAMGSSTEASSYKKTKNPWDVSRVPGGSSGGSAAAVAAGLVPWALGSDTGGSVRQPAALCGIVGMKPTYGRVSRYGLIAYGSSLDQIGVLTRTVYDNALILSVIAGQDPKDSTSASIDVAHYIHDLSSGTTLNFTIGVIENALHAEGMDPEIIMAIEKAIEILVSFGARVKYITLPTLEYSAATYFILSRAEAASNLARFDGVRYGTRYEKAKNLLDMYCKTRHNLFGNEVKTRIMVGNYGLSAGHSGEYYGNAKRVQHLMRQEFERAFDDIDVLLMPTHPIPAFKFGAFEVDILQMDLQDYFTCAVNITGVPAISVPCGFTKARLPIGFQFIGPHFSEQLLYKIAYAYEQATEWHKQHPNF